MSDTSRTFPEKPDLDWLRKQAKRRLQDLRVANPSAKLADAQFALAKEFGFASWRAMKAHIDALTLDGRIVEAAKSGEAATLTPLLDAHPDKLQLRTPPYGWTLLHIAAQRGHLTVVDLLLRRGLDVNAKEHGDNTTALHWAAAAGHVDVVRQLATAGVDVIGHGDDHALEAIGWATCWDGCDDDQHREVVQVLLAHGARHHIFSAMSLHLSDDVRRIVAANPAALEQPLSRNEDFQRPLHFAARRNLLDMAALLLELGADSFGSDASGFTASAYAVSPEMGRVLRDAKRRAGAAAVTAESPRESAGALHLAAKQGDVAIVRGLLDRGADPNGLWAHWDADVTPLHLACLGNHPGVVRVLLDAGADSTIKDNKHESDALGWAEFFQRADIVELIRARRPS